MAAYYGAVQVIWVEKGGTPTQEAARIDAAITAVETDPLIGQVEGDGGWYFIFGTAA
jgi:hypothetical protein